MGESVVVKIAQYLDHDEHPTLQFIEEHLPGTAAPRPLGLVTINSTSFLFMTRIPGITLETKWPSLSVEAKARIQNSLNETLLTLRQLELPPSSPFGSPVGQHLCKDIRRVKRQSTSLIYSEDQFNDFILHSPSSKAAPSYKDWLRSMMRCDHRIVFTHADLHPRNIMVVETPDGGVELTGIIDWEVSGFYPEYWEHLKALNTRSIRDTNDWWDYLPPSILGYDHEVLLDRVVEAIDQTGKHVIFCDK
ncbi:hypothetical protein AGABI2DRAFT_78938 [Agaricus bisporus var. bisporus H97]|uniref:hypothetical protein n=1 Tax=Agaricus bisporus var. bisporus (strain H97 / ATCC MYA-4626 / FGSC 10389) TaxID=936046 RepID=UPI00029F798C|nr:hypothetical protein AGABI2DRAFT_78938 [Agaricus bisporus var. bisporus H97]EKV42227.1 hypothetical protein AGABI2DRAFT_78938 [Agaricus bisporus var. bisporus H97]